MSCSGRDQLSSLAADAAQLLSSSALADAESAAYWAYHLGRTGFFLGAVSELVTSSCLCCYVLFRVVSGLYRLQSTCS
jgi:hypothetical protein